MMLSEDVDDLVPQLMVFCQLDSILHVGNENQAAHAWGKFVVFVITRHLILDKVLRLFDLSDVMIISAYPCEQRINIYGLSSRLCQVANDHAVMIGPGSLQEHLLQDGLI